MMEDLIKATAMEANAQCNMLTGFYKNASIFVTGGSGVVGKALIEKLLRSCNVRQIFVLLRPRRNLTIEQRLDKIKEAKVFKLLRVECAEQLNKLVPIAGDISLPMLGIAASDLQRLTDVSIVYHCAATVRFDESLRTALTLNVAGAYEALKFGKALPNLKIFMHVSTFFSNPYLNFVESKVYPAPMDWRVCLRLLSEVKDDALLDGLTRKMIVGFPNTYTFTKNLAESLVQDYAIENQMPVVIYRPSIVLFSLSEPTPGFSPSLSGAMGLFALVGAGILKTVYLSNDSRLDITPQDIGVKLMLHYCYQAHSIYQQRKIMDKCPTVNTVVDADTTDTAVVPIYQSSSTKVSPHNFKYLASQMDNCNLWKEHAFGKALMIPGCFYTSSRFLYMCVVFMKQILPALIVDFLLLLSGRKPFVMTIVRKGYTTLEVMQPFLFNNYESDGITDLDKALVAYNGTSFCMQRDFQNVQSPWHMVQLCVHMLSSIREDLLKESPATLKHAQKILGIKEIIYLIAKSYVIYKATAYIFGRLLNVFSS